MAHNIVSIETGKIGWNVGFSGTHRTFYIKKNLNVYPHQSRISFHTLLWDTLYVNIIASTASVSVISQIQFLNNPLSWKIFIQCMCIGHQLVIRWKIFVLNQSVKSRLQSTVIEGTAPSLRWFWMIQMVQYTRRILFSALTKVLLIKMSTGKSFSEAQFMNTTYGDPQVRVFISITWYKGEPAWTHALEGPHWH